MNADIRTVADLPFHVMGRFQGAPVVGTTRGGAVQTVTGKAFLDEVRDVSLGLSALGMEPGARVAIVAESRPEWVTVDLAVLSAGAVTVPVYPTLAAAQVLYILLDSGATLAVVSTPQQLEKLQEIRHQLPALQAIVVMDPAGDFGSPSVRSLAEVAERGHARLLGEWGVAKGFRDAARAVDPEQLATIIYTSGTTGEPKGVMLTHRAVVANIEGAAQVLGVDDTDVGLSFLPLSHAFERMVSWVYLYCGVQLVFAESFDTIGRDLALARPTVLTAVPRVYEKLQARVMEKGLSGSPSRVALFRWALRAGLAQARPTLRGRTAGVVQRWQARAADRLVWVKVRAAVGGRLRLLISGSAPLSLDTAEFFAAAGLPINEGYGLTETAPALTVNPPGAPRAGTVGRPLPGVELRIADDGEILARGPNLMAGYYNKPEATAEILRDGWLHTGDVGSIDAEGYLSITDRKKDLIVTSGGKNVAPQPIEGILKSSPLVAEAIVIGDRRSFISALIVPDYPALERRLKALDSPPGSRDELATRADVVTLYQEIVDALNLGLSPFERIRRITLLPTELTIASGELTPTLKIKRKAVQEKWKSAIEAMYS